MPKTTLSVLWQLTPREAEVLRVRFGIDFSTDYSLEVVGKQFELTRERIPKIEAKALRKRSALPLVAAGHCYERFI